MTTKLYHYSKDKYDILKTRNAQGIKDTGNVSSTNKLRSEILGFGLYSQHISLFLEKAPIDILGTIYKDADHEVWFTGSKLYEYEVHVEDMGPFAYDFVETPLEVEMFYDDAYDDMSVEQYMKMVYAKKLKLGLYGTDRANFIKKANELKGTITEQYMKLPSRPNWKDISKLYAPTVPHVMVYPEGGTITYHSIKQVTIGNKPVKLATESLVEPIYSKW